jgi:hypothetical protein
MLLKLKRYRLIYYIVLSQVLSGCYSLSTLQMDVLHPAPKTITPDIKRIAIVNASHSLINPMYTDTRILNRFIFDTLTFNLVAEKLAGYMNQSSRFDTVAAYDRLLMRDQTVFYKPLDENVVDSLCQKYQCDALLSIEATSIEDTIFKYSGVNYSPVWRSYSIGTFYVNYPMQALITRSRWYFYQPALRKESVSWIQCDTLFYNSTESLLVFDEILADEYNLNYLADELADVIAEKISLQIAPHWEGVDRIYFSYINHDFAIAASLITEDKWIEAINIWRKYENDQDQKLAAAACFNIALACEAQGKIDIAIGWLEKSIEKYPFHFSNNYLDILKQRQIETVKLDLQFGIKK